MKYAVKWMIEGQIVIEAPSKEEAETLAQQLLVATLTDENRWPAELGAQGIEGTATELKGELVG